MQIDEAIKRLGFIETRMASTFCPEDRAALQMGKEALKVVDNLRFKGSPFYPCLLPGETEE